MSIFAKQAERLRREEWTDPNLLAQEIYAIFMSKSAIEITSPVLMTQQEDGVPPLTFIVGTDQDGLIGKPFDTLRGGGTIGRSGGGSQRGSTAGVPPTTAPGGGGPVGGFGGGGLDEGGEPLDNLPPPSGDQFFVNGDTVQDFYQDTFNYFPPEFIPPPPPASPSNPSSTAAFGGGLVGVVLGKVGGITYRVQAQRGDGTIVATVNVRIPNIQEDDTVPTGVEGPLIPATDSSGRVTGGTMFVPFFMEPTDE